MEKRIEPPHIKHNPTENRGIAKDDPSDIWKDIIPYIIGAVLGILAGILDIYI